MALVAPDGAVVARVAARPQSTSQVESMIASVLDAVVTIAQRASHCPYCGSTYVFSIGQPCPSCGGWPSQAAR